MSLALLPKFAGRSPQERHAIIKRKLMRHEAKIGGKLFGPVPKGRQRQFFCLDEHTWIWYESWTDQNGQHRSLTTRYEVRPDGILKLQDGHGYQRLSQTETQNLNRAAQLYVERIKAEYQRLYPHSA
jgi:hypothetical protein